MSNFRGGFSNQEWGLCIHTYQYCFRLEKRTETPGASGVRKAGRGGFGSCTSKLRAFRCRPPAARASVQRPPCGSTQWLKPEKGEACVDSPAACRKCSVPDRTREGRGPRESPRARLLAPESGAPLRPAGSAPFLRRNSAASGGAASNPLGRGARKA